VSRPPASYPSMGEEGFSVWFGLVGTLGGVLSVWPVVVKLSGASTAATGQRGAEAAGGGSGKAGRASATAVSMFTASRITMVARGGIPTDWEANVGSWLGCKTHAI
jgi:hypothetical protein